MRTLPSFFPAACSIVIVFGLTQLSGCTKIGSPSLVQIPAGSTVTLNKGALACKQPSGELDRIATASETDKKVLLATLSTGGECHDSSAFIRNDSWQVEETIGTQLGVKMRGYVGKYWVSLAQVSLLQTPVSNANDAKKTVSLAPVTVEEWRKSLASSVM